MTVGRKLFAKAPDRTAAYDSSPAVSVAAERNGLREFTSKQMGDACEMLVAAELTLAGIPALKVPDNWPHYDVIAQPVGLPAQRISVKSRTYKPGPGYVNYNSYDQFDWLAIVILGEDERDARSIHVVPRTHADSLARQDKPSSKTSALRYFLVDEVHRLFETYRSNFSLFSRT